MKLSLFTPTHKPIYLRELYDSLVRQEGDVPWEWVIVPNGACTADHLPAVITKDARVRIVPSGLQGIGALKRFACEQCSGDVFVEMDHDDTLAPNAFSALASAYEQAPTGFYYSDFINVKPNGMCEVYGAKYGWEHYNVTIDNKVYIACRAFPATARSICNIFWAPNHVRAWSRHAYTATGGHDPALTVGDDHDLVCRTYLAGAPFVWIQKPLYIYRRTNSQSYVIYNNAIQIQQQANCVKYLHKLIEAECVRDGLQIVSYESAVVAEDFLRGFDSSSIGCFRVIDQLQRIPRTSIIAVMNTIYDVLKPGGWFISSTPSIDDGKGHVGRGAFQDPTHCSYWSENNFLYFVDRRYAQLIPDYKGRFQAVNIRTHFPNKWYEDRFIPFVSADLCALKGQRQPGEMLI